MNEKHKNSLPMYPIHDSWEKFEEKWYENASKAAKIAPLKGASSINPNIPKIATHEKRWLKLKAFFYLIWHDRKCQILRKFFKNPRFIGRYFLSIFKKQFHIEEGVFVYQLRSIHDFYRILNKKNTRFVLGFSYCHKPFECPSGRFTDQCISDQASPVCQQCFIGRSVAYLPKESVDLLIIPTVHYVGEKMLEIKLKYPNKTILFAITACEMTLRMFADWGNAIDICGIGISLEGRICNTMKAFELSEKGIKPGLTWVKSKDEILLLDIIKHWREKKEKAN